jgi:hypothetical protein
MKSKYLLSALALTVSSAAFAADPAPAPSKECCCCQKDEQGKMASCKEKADKAEDHDGHDMGGMDRK